VVKPIINYSATILTSTANADPNSQTGLLLQQFNTAIAQLIVYNIVFVPASGNDAVSKLS